MKTKRKQQYKEIVPSCCVSGEINYKRPPGVWIMWLAGVDIVIPKVTKVCQDTEIKQYYTQVTLF